MSRTWPWEVLRHDSLAAYLGRPDAKAIAESSADFIEARSAWNAGITGPEAIERTMRGDAALAASAGAVFRDLQLSPSESPATRVVHRVVGGSVCVPSYLAGHPACMRRRVPDARATHAVTIYVGVGLNGAVEAHDAIRKGAIVLGLLRELQTRRVAVDLWAYYDFASNRGFDCVDAIRIDSRPLDLSRSAFVLGHPAFPRRVCFSYACARGFFGRPPETALQLDGRSGPQYLTHLRTALGARESDIIVPGLDHWDLSILKNPIAWIQARVKEATA